MTDQSVILRTACSGSTATKPGRRTGRKERAAGRRRRRGARARTRRTERREAILAAALEEFSARGFAATRLDDVARRAGVAKGTIYLYFRDKESLFQELVRAMLSPLVGAIEAAPLRDLPIRAVAEMIVDVFVNEIYGTRRKDVIRLILAEGPRFPKLAEFYYREVIGRVLPVMRALLARAVERGELSARCARALSAIADRARRWSPSCGTACSSASRRSTCASSCARISICCSATGARHERIARAVLALLAARRPRAAATTARSRPSRAGSRPS